MLDTTLQAVKAVLKADPSMTPDGIKAVLTAAKNPTGQTTRQLAIPSTEAAKLLGVTYRTVARLTKDGYLTPCYLPGRKRTFGVSWESVENLIESKKV